MQTILRPSPPGPTRRDAITYLLFVPYFGGVVATAFGIQGICGLFMLGAGFAMTTIAGWLILLRDGSAVTRERAGVGQTPTREPAPEHDLGGSWKRLLLGRALASHKAEHQLLPKLLALPVFASDQLFLVAYATEEMLLVLVLVGASGIPLLTPLSLGVAALLVVVIVSYRQTVREYPQGGGSYIVAKENLGLFPGLTAAAAIQISYVLTVAVSVTAGAIAVTSAVPALSPYKMPMAIAFILTITVANLRGAKEAGRLFAIPTYGFVVVVGATLVWGTWRRRAAGARRPTPLTSRSKRSRG